MEIVFLPDACPGKSPLPTGTAVLTNQDDWRRFAISDCGCGMRLLKSEISLSDFTLPQWNQLADMLRANKGKLGDLGGGNHFLDALAPYNVGSLHFLIHTGSRNESNLVDHLVDSPEEFDKEFERVIVWAAENRATIQKAVESVFGKTELLLDLAHNSYEKLMNGQAIIRKGAVHIRPQELAVIPSHMSGDVSLVRAKDSVADILCSMSHGTGRKMPRGKCKPLADKYDFDRLRKAILIPAGIENASLRTEGPYAYRDLDECLSLIHGYVEEIDRFAVVGYMGHL
jgi:RNA-splicing ligase RtcB